MNGRAWTFGDLDEIARIEADCFPDPWNRRMLADALLSDRFFGTLLEEDGSVTAYGGITFAADEAEIELVATAEMFRRCGRGDRIVDDLLEEAARRGAKRVFLEVRVSNAPALMLYLKHGFAGLYARSRYYPDGEDALVMTRQI